MAMNDYKRAILNKMNSTAFKAELGAELDIRTYTSSAGAGGAATEAMVLTGLAAGDTIMSVSQKTPGANNLPLLGWTTQAANALTCVWSGNPGAGAVVVVTVKKA
jgi:hypothetical protein